MSPRAAGDSGKITVLVARVPPACKLLTSPDHAGLQALLEAAVLAAHAVAAVDVTATLGQARQLRRLPVLGAADEETLATQHEQLHVECQGQGRAATASTSSSDTR